MGDDRIRSVCCPHPGPFQLYWGQCLAHGVVRPWARWSIRGTQGSSTRRVWSGDCGFLRAGWEGTGDGSQRWTIMASKCDVRITKPRVVRDVSTSIWTSHYPKGRFLPVCAPQTFFLRWILLLWLAFFFSWLIVRLLATDVLVFLLFSFGISWLIFAVWLFTVPSLFSCLSLFFLLFTYWFLITAFSYFLFLSSSSSFRFLGFFLLCSRDSILLFFTRCFSFSYFCFSFFSSSSDFF